MVFYGGSQMVHNIIQNLLYTNTLSLMSLMLTNFQDFGFIMYFLIKAMGRPETMNFFILLFFFFITITTCLTMRLMIFVWRVQNNFINNNQINTSSFRKKFYLFQMKFYFLMLAYYSLMHLFFKFHPILIMLCSLILYPQIIKNLGVQLHQFDRSYVLLFVFPRFLLLLYFRGCFHNIENLRPYPILSAVSLLFFLISLVIIYLQTQYGSYFFIPRCLRWKQFNYFVKIEVLRRTLLGDPSDSLHSSTSKGSSGLRSILSGLFKSKSSKTKTTNEEEQASEDKTVDFSLMSKQSTSFKSETIENMDTEEQFIRMEEPQTSPKGTFGFRITEESKNSTDEENVCNICMESIFDSDDLVDVKDADKFDLKSKLFENLCKRYKNNHRMKTPCLHMFHTSKPA